MENSYIFMCFLLQSDKTSGEGQIAMGLGCPIHTFLIQVSDSLNISNESMVRMDSGHEDIALSFRVIGTIEKTASSKEAMCRE